MKTTLAMVAVVTFVAGCGGSDGAADDTTRTVTDDGAMAADSTDTIRTPRDSAGTPRDTGPARPPR